MDDAYILERTLKDAGFHLHLHTVQSAEELKRALEEGAWDLVISDYILPRLDALMALRILRESGLDLPFIIVSGKVSEEIAVSAMKAGAHDYVTKDNMQRLAPAILRELREADNRAQHRSSERARIESERRYRHLAESITDAFFALDKNLICIYWNNAAESMTGLQAIDAIGKHFDEIFRNLLGERSSDIAGNIARSAERFSFEVKLHKGEKDSFYEMIVYPTQSGYTIIASDINARKYAEELKKTQDEIREQLHKDDTMRMLGNLVTGVAHEVRNPLNAISVVTEALFMELENDGRFEEFKKHIQHHVDRLRHLMQDLLEIGKPIEKKKIIRVHPRDLINDSMATWMSCGATNGCTVRLNDLTNGNDFRLNAEPLRLQQVFVNLFDNAMQHSPAGSAIEVRLNVNDELCTMEVLDRGTGISDGMLSNLFIPFFTTRKKGTGMGLAIVKHIVEIHGGTVEVANNDPPPGCRARITIPVAQNDDELKEDTVTYQIDNVSAPD